MSDTHWDVYDPDEQLWACWHKSRGYISGWMREREYQKWYYIHFGCLGHSIPGRGTIYRVEADEKEAQREQTQSENR